MRLAASALTSIGRHIAEIVLFSPCVACGASLPLVSPLASVCESCWRALPRIVETTCDRCGLAWSGHRGVGPFTCLDCQIDPPALSWVRSWGWYKLGLEKILQAFKFQRHDFLCGPLSQLLNDLIRAGDTFDVIVPVPMHRTKMWRRGYNQAELLATALSRRAGIPSQPFLLRKSIERRPQSTLNRADRAANVRGVFQASPDAAGLTILLVDDIYTTGETILACAGALLRSGACSVSAVTVARA